MTDTGTTSAGRSHFEGQLSFLGLLVALLTYKRLVFAVTTGIGALAVIVTVVLPNWYTATARIMPPQQSQSNAVAILGQLGALAGGAASQALGLKNPSDIYVAMLKSRTVSDKLIQRFELKRVYDEELVSNARKELGRNSSINAGREGVITIEVQDKNPERAAAMANAYAEELQALTVHLAVSEAAQRRLFFEGQLKKAKADLVNAETELQRFSKESGLVNPQGQIGLTVAASAALRAQIAAREIQISTMRSFATETNPDVLRTQQELVALRAQLAKMDRDAQESKGDALIPLDKAPHVGLEYVRRYRDMKYFETLYEVLAKQYEIARIDEAKDATLIQILDVALPPDRRSSPKRLLIISFTTFFGFVVALLIALAKHRLSQARANPLVAEQLDSIREHARRLWKGAKK